MPLYRPLECGPQSRECCLAAELAVHSLGIWGLHLFRVTESGNGPQPCSIFRDPDELENGGQVLHTAAPGLGGLSVCEETPVRHFSRNAMEVLGGPSLRPGGPGVWLPGGGVSPSTWLMARAGHSRWSWRGLSTLCRAPPSLLGLPHAF